MNSAGYVFTYASFIENLARINAPLAVHKYYIIRWQEEALLERNGSKALLEIPLEEYVKAILMGIKK